MDKSYDYNMLQAEEAGVPVGTYVYSLATTTDQALEEAKLPFEKMDGYKVSYPVVFDLEKIPEWKVLQESRFLILQRRSARK